MSSKEIVLIYLASVNVFGFLIMGWDKRMAIKDMFRVPESVLFTVAIFGGSVGSMIGMKVWNHKVRKLKFLIGMPVVLAVQLLLGYVMFHNGLFKLIMY